MNYIACVVHQTATNKNVHHHIHRNAIRLFDPNIMTDIYEPSITALTGMDLDELDGFHVVQAIGNSHLYDGATTYLVPATDAIVGRIDSQVQTSNHVVEDISHIATTFTNMPEGESIDIIQVLRYTMAYNAPHDHPTQDMLLGTFNGHQLLLIDAVTHACRHQGLDVPVIQSYAPYTLIKDAATFFADLAPNAVILGGRSNAPLVAMKRPNHAMEGHQPLLVSEDLATSMHPIGCLRIERPDGTAVYWFPGCVYSTPGLFSGIMRTIAWSTGTAITDVADHPSGDIAQVFKAMRTPSSYEMNTMELQALRRNLRVQERNIADEQERKLMGNEGMEQLQSQATVAWKEWHTIACIPEDDTQKAREDIDVLLGHPAIEHIAFDDTDDSMHIYTAPITASSSDKNHRINEDRILGRFHIKILMKSERRVESHREDPIFIRNLERTSAHHYYENTAQHHGPHMQSKPCWGNIQDTMRTLMDQRMIVEAIFMIITYLQSYNPSDTWGASAIHWPLQTEYDRMWSVRNHTNQA